MSTLRIATEPHRALLDQIDICWAAIDPSELVPRARVVDDLLDLYGVTDDPAVQDEIGTLLGSLAGRSLFEGTEVRAALARLVAAAAVESAFARYVLP
jgi:hypothetical protein